MGNHTGLLEQGFEEALMRAAAEDPRKRFKCSDSDELPAGLPQTNAEIVMECLALYREDREIVDAAVQSALDYIQSAHGAANVKALAGALESRDHNPLSTEIATGMLASDQLRTLESVSASRGLQAIGVGVSVGAGAVVGRIAGAEVIFDFHKDHVVHGRTWTGKTYELDVVAFAGLEFSFWKELPLSGCFFGFFVDVAVGLFFVRYMHFRQRANDGTNFQHAGWSLQLPLGIAFPVPGMIGGFIGKQTARSRTQRATFSVVNAENDSDNITVNTSSTLAVTITNTSGEGTVLDTDATIELNMPSYFTSTDLQDMTISLSGWDLTYTDTSLILTLQSGYTWAAGNAIMFDIENVQSAGDVNSGDIETGYVVMTLDSKVPKTLPIKLQTEFDLVWESFKADMAWTASTTSADGFTLTGTCSGETSCSGTTTAYSQGESTITVVTTATDEDDNEWEFGFIFNYGINNNGSYPQVRAVMSKVGALQVSGNVFYGSYVTPSSVAPYNVSTAFYKDTSGNSGIAVTPTFDS